jgi:hypothetical protein
MSVEQDGLYRQASIAVDKYIDDHRGESFDLDIVCRHMEIHDAHKRDAINRKLLYEYKKGNLEKHNRSYRVIDHTLIKMNWRESAGAVNIPLSFPSGLDGTQFGFDGHISIPEKALLVLAGVTNTGKSVFMRNFLFKNMESINVFIFLARPQKMISLTTYLE